MASHKQNTALLVKQFQDYLQIDKGLSENSIFSYTYDIKKFQSYMEDNKKDLLMVKKRDVTLFLKKQKSKNISARSLARAVTALRRFYKYLEEENEIQENPIEKVETPEIKKNLPEYLTLKEIEELFNFIQEDDIYELRDKAMFELMYSSGLRISEACHLRLDDIDMEGRFIVVRGKGGRERLTPFGEQAYKMLSKYLAESRLKILKGRESHYIFNSKKSEHLNRKSVWRLLKKYLLRTNIKKSVTPHTFRHSFATHLVENNADLRSVQELLGHIDISTTQVYTHLSNKVLRQVHKKFHPRSG